METHSKKEDKLKQQTGFGHVSRVGFLDFHRISRLEYQVENSWVWMNNWLYNPNLQSKAHESNMIGKLWIQDWLDQQNPDQQRPVQSKVQSSRFTWQKYWIHLYPLNIIKNQKQQ